MGWKSAGGGSSPLTTKGDTYGYDTADARVPIGPDDQVYTADSSKALGVKWADVGAGGYSPILDIKGSTDDPPDDEFDDTSGMSGPVNGLDAKWTAVAGSSGTVSLLETGNVAKYDLTTRAGWLLLQTGSDGSQSVELRQDFTLADGDSIILAIAPAILYDQDSGNNHGLANNDHIIGVYMNADDAAPDTNTTAGSVRMEIETDVGGAEFSYVVQNTSSSNIIFSESHSPPPLGGMVYLRIARSGSTYYGFYSVDGATWSPMGGGSPSGTALNNLWIYVANAAAMGDPVPIQAVHWIRQGSNSFDPW